jgi:acyl-coenzyme A synthetase/AMP-(fatty) acid ligase
VRSSNGADAFRGKLKNHIPEAMSLVFGDQAWTYSDLLHHVEDLYNLWKPEINAGDVIYINGDYSCASISSLLVLARLGAIIVPDASTLLEESEKRYEVIPPTWFVNCEAMTAKLVKNEGAQVFSHQYIDDLRNNEEPGLVLFSSGSTGAPKAMVHNLNALLGRFNANKKSKLSIMIFLMFDHIGGINTLLNGLSIGSKLVFSQSRSPEEVSNAIQDNKVNVLPTSPTFLNLLLLHAAEHNYSFPSLKLITYGTEPMPGHVLARAKKMFPRVKMVQTYGTSETGIAHTQSDALDDSRFRISDPDTEVKIVDDELWLKSRTQISGYLNSDNGSFNADGWFMTGDLVEEAKDGYFRIVGRLKEVINVGGQKVMPQEVEEILLNMDGIKDCVVFPMQNPLLGQVVGCKVVTESGVTESTFRGELRKYCQGKLERYKIPVNITFVETLGHTSRFKKNRLGLVN